LPKQGTAILSAATLAEGLILLPEEAEIVDTDDLVDFLPLSSLMT
jgi:molybdopterin biosynthesis enzyme